MTILTRPLVSIGIPTYNRPQQLHRALASITTQTYPHFEVIVSDNCSPGPETHTVVKHFMKQDARIRYVRQSSNIGMFHNFKCVFEMAQGDYFTWLADDDIRADTFLERCLDIFEQPHQSPDLLLVNAYSQLIAPPSSPPLPHPRDNSGAAKIPQDLPSDCHAPLKEYDDRMGNTQVITNQKCLASIIPSTKTDQGCTTLGMSPSERYYQYLASIYTTQNAIGDLIHGVMKRKAVQPALMMQNNVLGWDRVFLSSLALKGEFYTIPEVLMYSSPDGMSTIKNAQKMAAIQGIQNPLYIQKAKWVRAFFLQKLVWDCPKLSLLAQLKLSLWLWTDVIMRTLSRKRG